MTLIERAIIQLTPMAETNRVDPTEHWIVAGTDEDDWEEVEDSETFCGDCIATAVGAFQKEHPEYGYVGSQSGQGIEHTDFLTCAACGKHIDAPLVLTEEELERWEGLSDEDLQITLPGVAWEICKLLRHEHDERWAKRLRQLARRVIAMPKLTGRGGAGRGQGRKKGSPNKKGSFPKRLDLYCSEELFARIETLAKQNHQKCQVWLRRYLETNLQRRDKMIIQRDVKTSLYTAKAEIHPYAEGELTAKNAIFRRILVTNDNEVIADGQVVMESEIESAQKWVDGLKEAFKIAKES